MEEKWNKPADQQSIDVAVEALKNNNFEVVVTENGGEAKKKVLEIVPKGAEVMVMTSKTLDTLGISEQINNSGDYDPVRNKLSDDNIEASEKRRLGAAPEWVIGSVHAVTEDGHILVASNTGSQLPAYAYGAGRVIWVVGTQKIVKDNDEGVKRIYEHSLPLESERAKKAYGVKASAVNKILIVEKEVQPGRITVILVKEVLGF